MIKKKNDDIKNKTDILPDKEIVSKKTIIYHDINTNDKFKHEVLVKH